jgi:type II secretory pathway pseudopilin PulG
MKTFTKKEIIGVTIIFSVVFLITFKGLLTSERRARDAQRRGDLGAISNALYAYQKDFGFFPPSDNGKIKACKADNFSEVEAKMKDLGHFDQNIYFQGLEVCEWGLDSLRDVSDISYPAYMQTLPKDPKTSEGISYLYFSNLSRFQIYSFLEGGKDEDGFDIGIIGRGLKCGGKVCSFGKSFFPTPLDKSIEEYEQELLEKAKSGSKQ